MKLTEFPDGQILYTSEESDSLTINQRLASWEDFQHMIVKNAALSKLYSTGRKLYTPYIMGSRSDRSFEPNGVNYVKDVLAPIVNAQDFSEVITLDPHSLALENAIDNLIIKDVFPFIFDAVVEITNGLECGISIIAPDFGAYKKVWAFCEFANKTTSGSVDIDFVSCEKVRGLDGKILHTKVSHTPKYENALIVDDICDGGRTFIEISKQILSNGFRGDLYLWVTHGIFSKGLRELSKYFKKIYTTNSVQDINSMQGIGMLQEKYLHCIHQTKVI
jgi:ribose-phosphate pyrophosphokinase